LSRSTAPSPRSTRVEFVRQMLVEHMHVAELLVGANFRFGYRAAGSTKQLSELVVLTGEVRYAAGGWLAAEWGVAAVVIVDVWPGGEFLAAFGIAAVEAGVCPFVDQSAVESFDHSVGLGSVWPGAAVLNVAERFGEKLRL
jgi:hypothetical protein